MKLAGKMKRKLTAIFVADIAQYSRLIAEDEEETLQRLSSYRQVTDQLIVQAGGRIFNTAGDAVLAEFPSALDAVRCAIGIQASLKARNQAFVPGRQMIFRIGITIGDVVERDGDLLGDAVNVAARLAGLAPIGGICLSRAAQEQVAAKMSVKFIDMGLQSVKNIPAPIHAFAISADASQVSGPGTTTAVPVPGQLTAAEAAFPKPGTMPSAVASKVRSAVAYLGAKPAWMLWSAFSLLLVAGALELLLACALTFPTFLGLNYCSPATDLSELHQLEDRGHWLDSQIGKLELARASSAPCLVCGPAGNPTGQRSETVGTEKFVLVLDLSRNMDRDALDKDGRPITLSDGSKLSKLALVKRALPPVFDELADQPITFVTVGSCDRDKIGAPTRLTGRALADQIRSPQFKTTRVGSSLAWSEIRGWEGLGRGADGKYAGDILLVTNSSPEDCNEGDCNSFYDALHREQPNVRIHVVNLGRSGDLKCVATKMGGQYFEGAQLDFRTIIHTIHSFQDPDCPSPIGAPNPGRRS